MKILHIISGNFGQGGAERLVADLAKAQTDLGHDVAICCFRKRAKNTFDIDERVEFYSFSKKRGLSFFLPFQIMSFIRKNSYDVVNCHLPAVFVYMLWSLIVCLKQKFFYTIHSNPFGEEKRSWIKKIRRFFFQKKRIMPIAISQQIKSEFESIYDIKDIPVILNGRCGLQKTQNFEDVYGEIESYKKTDKTKILIAIGRVSKEKNHQLLVETMNNLMDEDVILIIIGNKTSDDVWNACNAINKGKTYFLGSKSNIQDYLFCADIFCMSSIYEGLPISIIEAMSVGLPIVSTNVGAVPDVVKEGVNGFLSDDLELQTYIGTLRKALSLNVQEHEKMSLRNIEAFKEKYDIAITAKSYVNLYLSTIKSME